MQITWQCPDEIRAVVEPHLQRWLYLVPGWCLELLVKYDAESTEGVLWTSVDPDYRMATLGINAGWISNEEKNRRSRLVAHELLHVSMEPMRGAFLALLKATFGEKQTPLRIWAEEQWLKSMEGAVCDLANSIAGKSDEAA